MKNLRFLVIALGGVAAFLSLTVYPISRRVPAPALSWTHDMHVAIGPSLLRAAAIVAATFLVSRLLPEEK